ncbi:Phenoxybenzoate dioxygenase subunit beta [compost metagenome]
MLQAFEAATAQLPPHRVHREYFAAPPAPAQGAQGKDQAFSVRLSKSGRLIPVPSDASILEALLGAGVDVPYSCMSGICGLCTTGVLGGVPDHRDQVLCEAEKAGGRQIILCCSRAKSPELVLAL